MSAGGDLSGLVGPTLRQWIQARTGIHITDDNQAPVELALRLEAERHGLDPAHYRQRLLDGALPPQAFIDAITTNESYFFRAPEQMRVLVTRLIPERLAARPGEPVRILSLPCARGEEPYSIAILCEEQRIAPQSLQLVGADISATCVAAAARGRYGPLALRRTDADLARRWFQPVGVRQWQLEPALLPRLELHRLNLLTDAEAVLGRRFDVVFCENLLIYFDPPTTAAALAVLARLLVPDGWLFVDHAEWNIPRARFAMCEIDGCVGFRPLGAGTGLAPGAASGARPAPAPVLGQAPGGRPGQPASGRASAAVGLWPASSAPGAGRTPTPTSIPTSIPTPTRTPATATGVGARLDEAQAHYRGKRFVQALAAFDAVLAAVPGHAAARLGKARLLADCGEDFEALELTEALLHPAAGSGTRLGRTDEVEALALMGLLLHKKGLKDRARTCLEQVRARDPGHPSLALLYRHPPRA